MRHFIKIAEFADITSDKFVSLASLDEDQEITKYFKEKVAELKEESKKEASKNSVAGKPIAPRADGFLYFTCIMMHAAEASSLDDNGNLKKTANGENVQVGWDVRDNGSWVWKTNDDNIKPYKNANCLVPGTSILMSDGSRKAVENVIVGDEVITHKGRVKKVKEVFKHENNSEIYNITSKYNPKLSVTSEHPLYSLSSDKIRKKHLKDLKDNTLSISDISWNKAEDIAFGDFLISPNFLNVKTYNDITAGQARLLGYFAAEGSFSKKYGVRQSVNFTFGYHKKNIVDYVKQLVEEEFPECSVKIKEEPLRSVTNVTITGHGITEWFFHHIGEYSHDKKLSKEIVFSSDDEVKRQFLLGWMEGDGCITTGNKLVGISVSLNLSWQIWLMLKSLGISVGFRKVDSCKRFIPANNTYKEYDCRESYRIEVYGANAWKLCGNDSIKYTLEDLKHKNTDISFGDYTLHRVTNVEVEPYQGFVYNFEVEDDHSYIANGVIVHNSDIFPESELKKAYKNWVGKPLCLDHKSQSVDMIRGVIVDTVYDDRKKRIIALCALDKVNHPDLARKVASGYAASVSMGTAVGRAICTEKGCHRVARVESDFCEHMKMKSAYGEINVDLSPIELSIVVNGADPKAKIRRIIAATQKISQYVDRDILDEAGIIDNETLNEVNDVKNEIAEEIKQFESELGNNESLSKSDLYAQRGVGPEMFESTNENTANGNVPQAGSTARYAGDVRDCLNQLKQKFGELDKIINKIASVKGINNKNEDTVMVEKNAYYQGGGGVNEPARGEVKYPKEDAETIRNTQDKQMNGETPFPDVGPVDGLYPGDVEKKRQLQRIAKEVEERALRRQAATRKAKEAIQEKKAYYQGGGGVNEPTPGKVKYPNDVDANKIRDKEDKQMTGAPPFPDTGKVDELYPGDLKKKELLSRARLNAKFIKSANPDGTEDLGKSKWCVFAKNSSGEGKLILSASVKELAGDRIATQYHAIATRDYGMKIMDVIKTQGLDVAKKIFKGANEGDEMFGDFSAGDQSGKVKQVMQSYECKKSFEDNFRAPTEDEAKLFVAQGMESPFGMDFRPKKSASVKRAQTAPAMPGAMPGEPVDANPPAAVPASPLEPEGDMEIDETFNSAGETGAPTDQLNNIVNELSGLQADLAQAVEALESEGELEKELEEEELAPVAASVSVNSVRTVTAKNLYQGLIQSKSEVSDMIDEFGLMKKVTASSPTNFSLVKDLWSDAKSDSHKVQANAGKMLRAFVMYAEGVKALEKRAQISQTPGAPVGPATNVINPVKPSENTATPSTPFGNPDEKEGRKAFDKLMEMMENQGKSESADYDVANVDVESENGKTSIKNVTPDEAKKMLGTASVKGKGIMTRADRDVLRAKLAQKGIQFSDMLQKAHPKGGVQVEGKGDLGYVEDLPEQHNKMMEIATATVKSAAERIQKHVIAGAINPSTDFPSLIAEGLDAAAVAYWKSLYGEGEPQSKEFVNELVSEHKQKKEASLREEMKIKTQRSYELAHAMADRNLLTKEASVINKQVDKLLNYSDAEFDNLKSLIQNLPAKTASSIPEVGIYESGLTATASYVEPPPRDEIASLQAQFAACFANGKY